MANSLQEWFDMMAEHKAEMGAGDSLDDGPRDTPSKPWAHTARFDADEARYERRYYGE